MKEHPEFKGYFANAEDGQVYTMNDRTGRRLTEPRPMKPETIKGGYKRVALVKDKKRYHILVSRFILETYVGKCPEGMESCHFDRDPSNNRWPQNILWGTRQDNQADKKRHGTNMIVPKGEQSALAKLNAIQVRIIRRYCEMDNERGANKYIASVFIVLDTTICAIKHRKNWRHLS